MGVPTAEDIRKSAFWVPDKNCPDGFRHAQVLEENKLYYVLGSDGKVYPVTDFDLLGVIRAAVGEIQEGSY